MTPLRLTRRGKRLLRVLEWLCYALGAALWLVSIVAMMYAYTN